MTDYKMDADHPGLALDRGVQDVLGKGLDRIDGVLKGHRCGDLWL